MPPYSEGHTCCCPRESRLPNSSIGKLGVHIEKSRFLGHLIVRHVSCRYYCPLAVEARNYNLDTYPIVSLTRDEYIENLALQSPSESSEPVVSLHEIPARQEDSLNRSLTTASPRKTDQNEITVNCLDKRRSRFRSNNEVQTLSSSNAVNNLGMNETDTSKLVAFRSKSTSSPPLPEVKNNIVTPSRARGARSFDASGMLLKRRGTWSIQPLGGKTIKLDATSQNQQNQAPKLKRNVAETRVISCCSNPKIGLRSTICKLKTMVPISKLEKKMTKAVDFDTSSSKLCGRSSSQTVEFLPNTETIHDCPAGLESNSSTMENNSLQPQECLTVDSETSYKSSDDELFESIFASTFPRHLSSDKTDVPKCQASCGFRSNLSQKSPETDELRLIKSRDTPPTENSTCSQVVDHPAVGEQSSGVGGGFATPYFGHTRVSMNISRTADSGGDSSTLLFSKRPVVVLNRDLPLKFVSDVCKGTGWIDQLQPTCRLQSSSSQSERKNSMKVKNPVKCSCKMYCCQNPQTSSTSQIKVGNWKSLSSPVAPSLIPDVDACGEKSCMPDMEPLNDCKGLGRGERSPVAAAFPPNEVTSQTLSQASIRKTRNSTQIDQISDHKTFASSGRLDKSSLKDVSSSKSKSFIRRSLRLKEKPLVSYRSPCIISDLSSCDAESSSEELLFPDEDFNKIIRKTPEAQKNSVLANETLVMSSKSSSSTPVDAKSTLDGKSTRLMLDSPSHNVLVTKGVENSSNPGRSSHLNSFSNRETPGSRRPVRRSVKSLVGKKLPIASDSSICDTESISDESWVPNSNGNRNILSKTGVHNEKNIVMTKKSSLVTTLADTISTSRRSRSSTKSGCDVQLLCNDLRTYGSDATSAMCSRRKAMSSTRNVVGESPLRQSVRRSVRSLVIEKSAFTSDTFSCNTESSSGKSYFPSSNGKNNIRSKAGAHNEKNLVMSKKSSLVTTPADTISKSSSRSLTKSGLGLQLRSNDFKTCSSNGSSAKCSLRKAISPTGVVKGQSPLRRSVRLSVKSLVSEKPAFTSDSTSYDTDSSSDNSYVPSSNGKRKVRRKAGAHNEKNVALSKNASLVTADTLSISSSRRSRSSIKSGCDRQLLCYDLKTCSSDATSAKCSLGKAMSSTRNVEGESPFSRPVRRAVKSLVSEKSPLTSDSSSYDTDSSSDESYVPNSNGNRKVRKALGRPVRRPVEVAVNKGSPLKMSISASSKTTNKQLESIGDNNDSSVSLEMAMKRVWSKFEAENGPNAGSSKRFKPNQTTSNTSGPKSPGKRSWRNWTPDELSNFMLLQSSISPQKIADYFSANNCAVDLGALFSALSQP